MFELKPITLDGIARALEKAERYRLLNEPSDAESICLDILRIDPDNQKALVAMLLAVTDQFEGFAVDASRAQVVLRRLGDEYQRAYYAGIISERRAKAHFKKGGPGSGYAAYDGFREAMTFYEKAQALRPPGNDDAILRWNACARILMDHPSLGPAPEEKVEHPLE
jgi:tetratricopeptide (TPR) repeat protein